MNPHFCSIEARLDWLIQRSEIGNGPPHRRLNAIENQLTNLASSWRELQPIDPASELRMARKTREQLLAWVEERETVTEAALERLLVCKSEAVVDETVPAGWIRISEQVPAASTE